MRAASSVPFVLLATLSLQAGPLPPGGADDPSVAQRRAIRVIDDYIDALRKTGDPRSGLDGLKRAGGELEASEDAFLRRGDQAAAALSAIKQGDIFRMRLPLQADRQVRDEALKRYRRGEQLARQARHRQYQAQALIGQVRVEATALGLTDWGAATAHIEQALRLCEQLDDKALLADALGYSAQVQLGRGNTLEALYDLNQALAIAAALDDPTTRLFLYRGRADVQETRAKLGDFERNSKAALEAVRSAREDYEQARAVAQKQGFQALAGVINGQLMRLEREEFLIKQNSLKNKAVLKVFEPRCPDRPVVTEEFLPPPGVPGAPPGFLDLLNRAVKENFTGDARSYELMGKECELKGDNNAALQNYMKGVARIEADRRQLGDEQGRKSFFEDKVGCYHAAILHLLDRKRHAEAFELMERSRARVLADLLASKDIGLSRPVERELDVQFRKVEMEIGREQASLFKLKSDPGPGPIAARTAPIEARIRDLEVQRRRLLDRMQREAPRLRDLYASEPATLQDVQQFARREGATILDYLVLPEAVIVWLIDGRQVWVRSVFLPRYVLTPKVNTLVRSLTDRAQDPGAAFDQDTARCLFTFLVGPMLPRIQGEHLVILPHENLNEVPFEALLDPADRRYLGERFRITYAPSATILLRLKEPKRFSAGKMLVVAHTGINQGESDAVERLFVGRCTVRKDVRAADVPALVTEPDFVHIVAHGFFKMESPLYSWLELREGRDDAILRAADMFGLPLRPASLVVLAACESGRSEITRGNEMSGMIPPLIYAGAGTLVISRWKVDSEPTKLWVEAFYREGRSRAPGEAARLAQMELKKNPKYQHPYYWASFSVVGR